MKKFLMVAGALVASAVLAAPAPAQAQASGSQPTICDGTLPPGVYDDVVVPFSAACFIDRSYIRGDVLATEGGVLQLRITRSAVAGEVQCLICDIVELRDSFVGGGLTGLEIQFGATVCGSYVGGPSRLDLVDGLTIGGSPECAGAVFGGSLALGNSSGVTFARSTVLGDLDVTRSRGPATLRDSAVAGTLSCTDNNPAPTVTRVAARAKTGQCAAV